MVPVKIEAAPVKIVAPTARDDVDGSQRGDTRAEIEIERSDLELLHHLLRKVEVGVTSVQHVHQAQPVQCEQGGVGRE